MTKQDFELIARVVREATFTADAVTMRRSLATEFADALTATNPRFDRVRFLKACVA